MTAPTIAQDAASLELLLAEPERPCDWTEANGASPCQRSAEWIAAGHCRFSSHAALLCSPHKTELLRILSEGYRLTCRHGNQSFMDEMRPI